MGVEDVRTAGVSRRKEATVLMGWGAGTAPIGVPPGAPACALPGRRNWEAELPQLPRVTEPSGVLGGNLGGLLRA